MKRYMCVLLTIAVLAGILAVTGCETQAQNKALIGGAIGAGAGQLIGGNTEGTLIGAGIGAGAGYLWGRHEDNKAKEESAATTPESSFNSTNGTTAAGSTMTMWITNSNGTRTEVKLKRNADGSYTGPNGKTYPKLPTEEELKRDYGF